MSTDKLRFLIGELKKKDNGANRSAVLQLVQIGTPEARKVLEKVADTHPDVTIRQMAQTRLTILEQDDPEEQIARNLTRSKRSKWPRRIVTVLVILIIIAAVIVLIEAYDPYILPINLRSVLPFIYSQ
jgi:hypothetical protein